MYSISFIGVFITQIIFNYGEIVMDLTGIAFNTADVLSVGSLVLVATAVIWGVRKAIGMAR